MAMSSTKVLLALFFSVFVCGSTSLSPQVPAIYVFGDSTADVGNNNYLPGNNAKANFPHYGIDFPHSRPTGRFSNGYNGIDFIATTMGFRRSPPPYLSLNIHHVNFYSHGGASFASGGSGVLDTTGSTITLTQQVEYFKSLRSHTIGKVGERQANNSLSRSIFLLSAGGNDIFAFFGQNSSPNKIEIEQFIGTMTSTYKSHFVALYSLGARKFGIVDVPPIGCCPYSRALDKSGNCLVGLNEMVKVFNKATQAMMDSLSSKLIGMKYAIGSAYAVVESIIDDPQALGFKEVKSACCGSGRFNAEVGCSLNVTVCDDRHQYLFWDSIHPTHATSKLAGWAFYGGSTAYVHPINFKQLIEAGN